MNKLKENTSITKEFEGFLNKNKVKVDIKLDFPEYKIYPVDLQLALEVISKHRSNFVINFVKKEK